MARTGLLVQTPNTTSGAPAQNTSYSNAISALQASTNGSQNQGAPAATPPSQMMNAANGGQNTAPTPQYAIQAGNYTAQNTGQAAIQAQANGQAQAYQTGAGGTVAALPANVQNAYNQITAGQTSNHASQIAAIQAAIQAQNGGASTASAAEAAGGAGAAAAGATGTTAAPQLGQWEVDPRMQQYLENLYSGNLQSSLAALDQQYAGTDAAYAYQLQELAKQQQADLTRNAVENQQAQQAWNESRSAYGLSSGTMGQAALARQNRQASGAAALRAANQSAMGKLALEQATAKSKYEAAVRQAIADNDYQKAQALYNAAKEAEQWQQEQYLNELNWQHQLEMAQINYNNQIAAMYAQYNLEHGLQAGAVGEMASATAGAAASGMGMATTGPTVGEPSYSDFLAAQAASGAAAPATTAPATPSYTPTAAQQTAPAGTQQQTAPTYDAYANYMASLAGGTPKKNGTRP